MEQVKKIPTIEEILASHPKFEHKDALELREALIYVQKQDAVKKARAKYEQDLRDERKANKAQKEAEKCAEMEKLDRNIKLLVKGITSGVFESRTPKLNTRECSKIGLTAEYCIKVVDDYQEYARKTNTIKPRAFRNGKVVAKREPRNPEMGQIVRGYELCNRAKMERILPKYQEMFKGQTVVIAMRPFDTDTYNRIVSKWESGSGTVYESQAQDSGLWVYVDGTLMNDCKGIRYKEVYGNKSHLVKDTETEQLIKELYEIATLPEYEGVFDNHTAKELLDIKLWDSLETEQSAQQKYRANLDCAKAEQQRLKARDRMRRLREKRRAEKLKAEQNELKENTK